MCVVGATTATRATRPSESIRWATWSPNVVLPAAGVAEARKASPSWANTAAAAACCQARSGRPVGQVGRVLRGGESGCVTEAGRLGNRPDGSLVAQRLRRGDPGRQPGRQARGGDDDEQQADRDEPDPPPR